MTRHLSRLFNYLSYLWISSKSGKPDVKKVLAIFLTYNFASNFSFAVKKWSEGKSLDGLSNSLMIEAGLIAAMLSLASFFSFKDKQLDNSNLPPQTDSQNNSTQNQNDSPNAQ